MKMVLVQFPMFLIVMSMCFEVIARDSTTASDTGDVSQTADAEAQLLEGLHYSREEFMRLYATLPRDPGNKVDWEQATAQGMIDPLASVDPGGNEEKIFDLRVVIHFDDMLVKNVVFSHAIHTYWLDCSSCHPKLFIPEIGVNKMTMQAIREGQYCGKCHGMVAFPTEPHSLEVANFRAVCKRCHREKRE